MVKNIPTIERSTKIRFGKHQNEEQADNTIVFNASNSAIDVVNSGAVYLKPVRNRTDYTDSNIVLLMYNKSTHEITESGEAATDIIEPDLQSATAFGNTTNVTSEFINAITSVVTLSNVGIANSLPTHTLDIGANVSIDDVGSNVIFARGNVFVEDSLRVMNNVVIEGNLIINGDITEIDTTQLTVEDGIIQVGKNNTSDDVVLDLGLLMTRPTTSSNVMMVFSEDSDELVLAYTDTVATSNSITPTSETLNVHVYGQLFTESNIGISTTTPRADLDVNGDVIVSGNANVLTDLYVSGDANVLSNLYVAGTANVVSDLYVDGDANVLSNLYVAGTANVISDLYVRGDANALSNLYVAGTANVISNLYVRGDANVLSNLYVAGTANVISDLYVDGDANVLSNLYIAGTANVISDLYVDGDANVLSNLYVAGTANVIGDANVLSNLYVAGTANVLSNLYVAGTANVIGDANVLSNLYVAGTANVISDLYVDGDANVLSNLYVAGTANVISDLYVDGDANVLSNLYVAGTANVISDLYVRGDANVLSELYINGNAYVSSNIISTGNTDVSGTLNLSNATTALTTDLSSNVIMKIDQLSNVTITNPLNDQILVYENGNLINEFPIHNYIKIKNDSGVQLETGNVVYITGYHNQNVVKVALAKGDSEDTMPAIGIMYEPVAIDGEGVAVAYGKVNGFNTSTFVEGDTLYVSNVESGVLSNVKPYGINADLIQNVGVCVRSHSESGAVFVTGIGRSNDIPNANVLTDDATINFVYVNTLNNDLKKIEPSNLMTKTQTFADTSNVGNTTTNVVQFNNITTGLVTAANIEVGSNLSIAGLADATNKYVPMVGTDGFLEQSPIYFTSDGTYVVSAAEAEFLGNLTLSGNTVILNSNNVTIEDRIFGIGQNNAVHNLDTGIMMEHKDGETYANIALIYHADEHRFSIGYTQNTFTDDHIENYIDSDHIIDIDLIGNVEVQNNLVVNNTANVSGNVYLMSNLIVGVDKLIVDVENSNVGVNTSTPLRNLDVNGDARVQSTTDTAVKTGGALVVSGGMGVASNIHSTNVYAATHVGVGTDAATAPLHVMGTDVGKGILVKNTGTTTTDHAQVALEVSGATGGDPFISFNVSGGEAFSLGADNSINKFVLANHVSDLGTNARVGVTADGVVDITNTTNATSTLNGALTIAGGVGVAKDVVASNLYGNTFAHQSSSGPTAYAVKQSSAGATQVNTASGQDLSLRINDVEKAVLASDGRFGIGATPTAKLHVDGNVYASSNLNVDANVFVKGGLITNTGGFTRKTYSFSDTIADTTIPGDAKITLTFSNHTFSARILAHLSEGNDALSTISFEVNGGNRAGTTPANNIAVAPINVYGTSSDNPWSDTVNVGTNTVDWQPSQTMASAGNYDVFVEYYSPLAAGALTSLTQGATEKIQFNY